MMGKSAQKVDLAEAAKSWIDAHYAEKFSLEVLARELFINKSYLLRVFKKKMGETPLYYHNHRRCETAQALLKRAELSIAFVGREVGFISASHFTRVFKSMCGCTPSEFRRETNKRNGK